MGIYNYRFTGISMNLQVRVLASAVVYAIGLFVSRIDLDSTVTQP